MMPCLIQCHGLRLWHRRGLVSLVAVFGSSLTMIRRSARKTLMRHRVLRGALCRMLCRYVFAGQARGIMRLGMRDLWRVQQGTFPGLRLVPGVPLVVRLGALVIHVVDDCCCRESQTCHQ